MLNDTFSVIFKQSEFMFFGIFDNFDGKYFFSSSTLSLGHHEIAFKLLWYFHTWCQRFILMKIPLLKLCLMRRSLKGLCAKRFYSLVRGLVNIPGRHNSPTENIAEFWHFPPRARWEQTRYTSCKKERYDLIFDKTFKASVNHFYFSKIFTNLFNWFL